MAGRPPVVMTTAGLELDIAVVTGAAVVGADMLAGLLTVQPPGQSVTVRVVAELTV